MESYAQIQVNIPLIFKIAPFLIRPHRVSAWETSLTFLLPDEASFLEIDGGTRICHQLALSPFYEVHITSVSGAPFPPPSSSPSMWGVQSPRLLRACSEALLFCLKQKNGFSVGWCSAPAMGLLFVPWLRWATKCRSEHRVLVLTPLHTHNLRAPQPGFYLFGKNIGSLPGFPHEWKL